MVTRRDPGKPGHVNLLVLLVARRGLGACHQSLQMSLPVRRLDCDHLTTMRVNTQGPHFYFRSSGVAIPHPRGHPGRVM